MADGTDMLFQGFLFQEQERRGCLPPAVTWCDVRCLDCPSRLQQPDTGPLARCPKIKHSCWKINALVRSFALGVSAPADAQDLLQFASRELLGHLSFRVSHRFYKRKIDLQPSLAEALHAVQLDLSVQPKWALRIAGFRAKSRHSPQSILNLFIRTD